MTYPTCVWLLHAARLRLARAQGDPEAAAEAIAIARDFHAGIAADLPPDRREDFWEHGVHVRWLEREIEATEGLASGAKR